MDLTRDGVIAFCSFPHFHTIAPAVDTSRDVSRFPAKNLKRRFIHIQAESPCSSTTGYSAERGPALVRFCSQVMNASTVATSSATITHQNPNIHRPCDVNRGKIELKGQLIPICVPVLTMNPTTKARIQSWPYDLGRWWTAVRSSVIQHLKVEAAQLCQIDPAPFRQRRRLCHGPL